MTREVEPLNEEERDLVYELADEWESPLSDAYMAACTLIGRVPVDRENDRGRFLTAMWEAYPSRAAGRDRGYGIYNAAIRLRDRIGRAILAHREQHPEAWSG